MSGKLALSIHATDEQTTDFTRSLPTAELADWHSQQEAGAAKAPRAEDRATHARGAQIARRELQRRS